MLAHAELTERIVAAANAVHGTARPGSLEADDEESPATDLDHLGIRSQRRFVVPMKYPARQVGDHRVDFLVKKLVVMDSREAGEMADVFFTIVRSFLKAARLNAGFLLNSVTMPLTIRRVFREDIARA